MENSYLRFARLDDSSFLYELRTDPSLREFHFSQDEINREDHEVWFSSSLVNPSRVILVLCNDAHERVGQVRYDLDYKSASCEIDISISARFHGKGFGTFLLRESLHLLFSNFPISTIFAKIKLNNPASLALFRKCSFVEHEEHDIFVTLICRKEAIISDSFKGDV